MDDLRGQEMCAQGVSATGKLSAVDNDIANTSGDIAIFDIGTSKVRVGLVGVGAGKGHGPTLLREMPCCVARSKREGADPDELVNGASTLAGDMYSKFRE